MTHGKMARLLGGAALLAALALFLTPASALAAGQAKAAYVMTNATHNHILIYKRASTGTLSYVSSVSTYGRGTGNNLGSQGALALSANGHWLFAVNAVSNSVSVFRVRSNGHLTLTDVAPSDGIYPVSLTVHGNVLYVLNQGLTLAAGPLQARSAAVLGFAFGNIAGLRLNSEGELTPISDSEQPLSTGILDPTRTSGSARVIGGALAEQISFNPAGSLLVVTEKATDLIDTFKLNSHEQALPVVTHASEGETPYGFAFGSKTTLIVSEAQHGTSGASTVSSYDVTTSTFSTLSASVPDTQTAACWLIVTPSRKYAYVANAGSGSLSSYSIAAGGTIALLTAQAGLTGPSTSHPVDMAFGHGSSRVLYALCSGNGTIVAFTVASDGSLSSLGTVSGLPLSVTGLAAW